MPRPKSIIQRIEIDQAKKAHNCQHNQRHRVERGDRRLKVSSDRSAEYYCIACARGIIERDIATLRDLAVQLQDPLDDSRSA